MYFTKEYDIISQYFDNIDRYTKEMVYKEIESADLSDLERKVLKLRYDNNKPSNEIIYDEISKEINRFEFYRIKVTKIVIGENVLRTVDKRIFVFGIVISIIIII